MARFKRASRTRRYLGRVTRRARSVSRRLAVKSRGFAPFRGIPSYAKPSKVTALTGVAVGVGTLLFTPLPNGDSWLNRTLNGISAYKANPAGGAVQLISLDPDGNSTPTILVAQLKQNAVPSIVYIAGFGIAAGILKRFGL